MATFALTDASVTVGGTDLSAWVRSVSLTLDKDAIDDTNMGDSTHINLAGLKNWSISITFSQDFASSAVDDTLWTIYNAAAGTAAIIVVPTSGAVSATNPSYTGTGLLTSYPPLDGSVGDHAEVSVEFVAAGDQARATV
jgi:predicted secreted protein